jgi:hypothetical protein
MLKNIFFTIIFFILDHFFLLLAAGLISLVAMKFCYKYWQDQFRGPDGRYISLIILIVLTIFILFFLIGVIYILAIIITFLPELRKVMGK